MIVDDPYCQRKQPREQVYAMPFTGAACQAAALWADSPPASNPILVNPVPEGVAARAAAFNAASSKVSTYGGRTAEIDASALYYDPRAVAARCKAPAQEGTGLLYGGGILPVGVGSEFNYTLADVKPKTQYAPVGDLITETVVVDAVPEYVGCCCIPQYPYSVAKLFMEAPNVLKVRALLVQAGVVTLTPALAAVGLEACPCKILGGECGLYAQLSVYAQQYMDTSVIQVPQLGTFMDFINTEYVQRVIGTLKAMVSSQARNNYLKAEGNRAFLQDYPATLNETLEPLSYGVPETLPTTGCTVVPQDTLYATYALTAPIASLRNREKMSLLANLPIGQSPVLVPNILPVCTDSLQTLPRSQAISAGITPFNPGPFLL
jgi:hypothetical protein